MRTRLDCFPCFLRQVLIALRFSRLKEHQKAQVLKAVLPIIQEANLELTPAHTTTLIHRRVRQLLGQDPFRDIKREYNQVALRMYPALRRLLLGHPRGPLWAATRLAIAGNVIDFGIFSSVDIEGTIRRALEGPLAVEHYEAFREALGRSPQVLYLLDNAGEVAFDRLLIEVLKEMGKQVVAVLKGSAVINDATMEDAQEVGLQGLAELIHNGSDCVGTILELCSAGFRERFMQAPLVISKGQGNFETLMNAPRADVFFLFQSKCDVVSRELGLERGAMLLLGKGLSPGRYPGA